MSTEGALESANRRKSKVFRHDQESAFRATISGKLF